MHVPRKRVDDDIAVHVACPDAGHFVFERHPRFGDQRLTTKRLPCGVDLARVRDHELALAVVTVRGALEHRRPADLLEPETVYLIEVLRTATDTEGRALATGAAWEFRTSTEVSDVLLAATSPTRYLKAISPNPFTHQTTITFSLPEDVHSRLALYDTHGRRVRLLVDDQPGAGHHTASWDGTDDLGRPVAAGVYFVRLQFAERAAVGKVVVRR